MARSHQRPGSRFNRSRIGKSLCNGQAHHSLCKKYSKDEDGNQVNSWPPIGISRGGLFSIEGLDLNSIRNDTDCKGGLIGILIELHRAQKVLVAVKLSTIHSALTNAGKGRS